MPVIGVLGGGSLDTDAKRLGAFQPRSKRGGLLRARTLRSNIVGGWQYDRLATLAADLVRRQVAMIAATSVGPRWQRRR